MSVYTEKRPEVYRRYNPPGPGGSYNVDEPPTEKPDRDLSMSQQSVTANIVDSLYNPDQVQAILDAALSLAMTQLNPIISGAISDKTSPDVFAELARVRADDVFETCVHRVVSRGLPGVEPYDLLTLAPLGVVNFLDTFMNVNRGRVYRLESELVLAYETYLTSKMDAK